MAWQIKWRVAKVGPGSRASYLETKSRWTLSKSEGRLHSQALPRQHNFCFMGSISMFIQWSRSHLLARSPLQPPPYVRWQDVKVLFIRLQYCPYYKLQLFQFMIIPLITRHETLLSIILDVYYLFHVCCVTKRQILCFQRKVCRGGQRMWG